MNLKFETPLKVPVMTLEGAVLFPQAIMPLYIFEPRYKQMLDSVLQDNRMFAIAGLNTFVARTTDQFEPPFEIATLGLIRVSHRKNDGTSKLILQGLKRIRVGPIVQEEPFRIIEVGSINGDFSGSKEKLTKMRLEVFEFLQENKSLGGDIPQPVLDFLKKVEDPEVFIDMAAYSLNHNTQIKQILLETLKAETRFNIYKQYLKRENEQLRLINQIKRKNKPGQEDHN